MEIEGLNSDGLKDLARGALLEALGGPPLIISQAEKLMLSSNVGVFVTIKVKDELRGCIGRLDNDTPLWKKIPSLACAAAFEDNRFEPLSSFEIGDLTIEITILDEPVRVNKIEEIEIGRDGLIIEKDDKRGLLLPQVAEENGWSREEFVSHTCIKAGLEADAWKQEGAAISRFVGIVYK